MTIENKLSNLQLNNNETNVNNVLTIKTVQIAPFRILMTALKDILLDTNIVFTKDGIRIINMDKTHTILVHLLLKACNFEFYEDKVIVTQKNLKIERKWSELKYVTFGKYGICFVEKSTSGFAFIPNDAFLTDTDMTDFKESISRKIKVKRR